MALTKPPFAGKVIAITGGASGIGFALAEYLAARGATISICDVAPAQLEKAAASLSSLFPNLKLQTAAVDVRNDQQVSQWIESVCSTFGKLDGCANMAGIAGRGIGKTRLVDMDNAEWESVVGINLTGTFKCLRAQLKHVSNGGSIVNAASVAGVVGMAGCSAYCASKHGVVGLTRTAAKEGADQAIRVNCICPGPINTPLLQTAAETQDQDAFSIPLKRKGSAEEVAALIAFLLGDDSRYITGAVYSIDGGWTS
ncbi:hypothetical protein AYO21_02045 [Fonsecaea monophora]|uniref:Ketoreductase domain-containing protein n=1 Tax=Fonsecaea monophora TaxID=254056 RepID=A0A177FHT9_9EURO|nr:hypothetical protein AYO21_02045 [Fonsecaea monophora]KAH0844627.1 Levodione reductase [Fonsecaea pedrosoi]OAG43818.1 hypothetical protein AYO21_02045 [Fonsecaea monophora]